MEASDACRRRFFGRWPSMLIYLFDGRGAGLHSQKGCSAANA